MEGTPTIEQAINRIDDIAVKLEKGDLPLEESLKLYEEATGLIRQCNSMLDEAEQKVMQLVKGTDGTPSVVPFTENVEFE